MERGQILRMQATRNIQRSHRFLLLRLSAISRRNLNSLNNLLSRKSNRDKSMNLIWKIFIVVCSKKSYTSVLESKVIAQSLTRLKDMKLPKSIALRWWIGWLKCAQASSVLHALTSLQLKFSTSTSVQLVSLGNVSLTKRSTVLESLLCILRLNMRTYSHCTQRLSLRKLLIVLFHPRIFSREKQSFLSCSNMTLIL